MLQIRALGQFWPSRWPKGNIPSSSSVKSSSHQNNGMPLSRRKHWQWMGHRTLWCYLWGQRFEVITNHTLLQWLQWMKDTNPNLMWCYLVLQPFVFIVRNQRGCDHAYTNIFSWHAMNTCLEQKAKLEGGRWAPKDQKIHEIDQGLPFGLFTSVLSFVGEGEGPWGCSTQKMRLPLLIPFGLIPLEEKMHKRGATPPPPYQEHTTS